MGYRYRTFLNAEFLVLHLESRGQVMNLHTKRNSKTSLMLNEVVENAQFQHGFDPFRPTWPGRPCPSFLWAFGLMRSSLNLP